MNQTLDNKRIKSVNENIYYSNSLSQISLLYAALVVGKKPKSKKNVLETPYIKKTHPHAQTHIKEVVERERER